MTLLERCYWIIRRPSLGNPHFEKLVDELVICNRDLTAEEFQETINKETWVVCPATPTMPLPQPRRDPMQDDVATLFAYDRWANTRVLDACRKLTAEQYVAEPVPGWSSVRSTIYHIAMATEWNLRTLAGDPDESIPTEADVATVDDAARLLEHAYRRFEELLPTLTPERLNTVLTLHGRACTARLPPWAVLRHIVNHSTYHRGQVASKLKRFGIEQPNTDFFFWVIEQIPEGNEQIRRLFLGEA
jgi:uncharacterized damage-inducible protein DinB